MWPYLSCWRTATAGGRLEEAATPPTMMSEERASTSGDLQWEAGTGNSLEPGAANFDGRWLEWPAA